jgi:hypothetical protein
VEAPKALSYPQLAGLPLIVPELLAQHLQYNMMRQRDQTFSWVVTCYAAVTTGNVYLSLSISNVAKRDGRKCSINMHMHTNTRR